MAFVVDRVRKKAQNWKGKTLTHAGREVLNKKVLKALQTFVMPVFKVPQGILVKVEKLIRCFWWSSNMENQKMRWVRWGKMTKSKKLSELGFRDLEVLNPAILPS